MAVSARARERARMAGSMDQRWKRRRVVDHGRSDVLERDGPEARDVSTDNCARQRSAKSAAVDGGTDRDELLLRRQTGQEGKRLGGYGPVGVRGQILSAWAGETLRNGEWDGEVRHLHTRRLDGPRLRCS